MRLCMLVVLASVVLSALGDLPPPERSYKILMLLPVASKSHRNVFLPIANALADRGHEITMLSNLTPVTKHPKIYEIDHGLREFDTDNVDMFKTCKDPRGGLSLFFNTLPAFAKKFYNVPRVWELFERRKEFDLIVINHMFNEVAYPFAHEMPMIMVATPGMDNRQSAVMGNVLNPIYFPYTMMKFPPALKVLSNAVNIFAQIYMSVLWRNWAVVPAVQKEVSRIFPDFPPLLDIERNMSLVLLNYHYSMETTFPLLPSQIPVAGMHCKAAKPLPLDLLSWIEGADHGVIYFSLGSITRGNSMPVKYRDLFVQAFAQMKQRIIWKFEEELEGLSDNVLIRKWLPQQDLLGHPNVKVFITHGGLLSTQEAMYHATPALAIPIFADQPKNALRIQEDGFGLSLIWEELTVDLIVNSLEELINNEKYSKNIAKTSIVIRDQMETPIERAVWWIEYVLRHQGAPSLRCPGADLSWIEYFCLDVLFIVYVILFAGYWFFKKLFCKLFGKKKEKQE
ncbi:UDP-glucosyltransferase 2-like isoform X2 [Oratosquilla oratoria]